MRSTGVYRTAWREGRSRNKYTMYRWGSHGNHCCSITPASSHLVRYIQAGTGRGKVGHRRRQVVSRGCGVGGGLIGIVLIEAVMLRGKQRRGGYGGGMGFERGCEEGVSS
jgi:hypothetical protein